MKDMRELPLLCGGEKDWELRRQEIRTLLEAQMYGRIPGGRSEYSWMQKEEKEGPVGSRCVFYQVVVKGSGGSHEFPFRIWLPQDGREKHPVMVYLGVNGDADKREHQLGEKGMPPVWLLERGFAVAVCMAVQIEPDQAEGFPAGLARAVKPAWTAELVREAELETDGGGGTAIGALAAWAEGMRIVLDLLEKREDIQADRMAVSGCSRCGKAALWCGAQDERVWMTVSFDSGCGGAAPTRGKKGERLTDMLASFPHWLCGNAEKYAGREEETPFDQHFLLALIAPRRLLVTSSTQDIYCDPYGEFLGLAYAGEAYEQYGLSGIDTWIWPPVGKLLVGDGAAYYLREGEHGVEEEDWKAFLEYAQREMG